MMQLVNDAASSIGSGSNTGGLVAGVVALEALANLLDAAGGGVGDSSGVAVVGVDAGKEVAVGRSDAGDDDVTISHGVAVSAGSPQLAKVLHGEVLDGEGAAAVVLGDLVGGSIHVSL